MRATNSSKCCIWAPHLATSSSSQSGKGGGQKEQSTIRARHGQWPRQTDGQWEPSRPYALDWARTEATSRLESRLACPAPPRTVPSTSHPIPSGAWHGIPCHKRSYLCASDASERSDCRQFYDNVTWTCRLNLSRQKQATTTTTTTRGTTPPQTTTKERKRQRVREREISARKRERETNLLFASMEKLSIF